MRRDVTSSGHRSGVGVTVTVPVAAGLVFSALVAVGRAVGIPIEDLSPDVQAVGGHDFYIGAISQLGLFGWTTGAAVALFGGIAVRKLDRERGHALIGLGLVTVWLAVDDMFMLHEQPIPKVGIPESVAIGAMGVAMVAVVARYRATLLRTPVSVAVMAGVAFAVSIGADLALDHNLYIEDGFKFIGLTTWAAFLCLTAYASVERAIEGR